MTRKRSDFRKQRMVSALARHRNRAESYRTLIGNEKESKQDRNGLTNIDYYVRSLTKLLTVIKNTERNISQFR